MPRWVRRAIVAVGAGLLVAAIVLPDISHGRSLIFAAAGALIVALFAQPVAARSANPQRRRVARVGTLFLAIYLTGAARLLRMTVAHPAETGDRVGFDPETGDVLVNPRRSAGLLQEPRGRILAGDGTVLSETVVREGIARRAFHEPSCYPVLGYNSPLKFGLSGLELTLDEALTGERARSLSDYVELALFGRAAEPADVELTLDLELQRLAAESIEGYLGSAVLMEAETGRVLAMASAPTFDPNALVAVDAESAAAAQEAWEALLADPNRPLLLRATTGLYPPGSTFKVMMAAAAIEEGLAQPDTVYEDSGALEIEGRVMVEPNRPDERRTDWTLTDGLAYSLNVLYAQVGLQLGADSLRALAERFGIGRALPFTLPVAEGQVASSGEFLSRRTAVADTAIGQGELLVTPLHMAVATSAIAAGGRLPRPTLVGRIDGDSAGPGPRAAPESLGQAVSPQTASAVRQMMIESAAYGYASAAQIPGYAVGAKTGTAESGQEAPHSWFVAFAEAGKRTHVVSVCIEHGGEGGGIALQVGRRLLEASLLRD